MCYGQQRACFGSLCSLVCLGWALGVFFGLNYPEIRRNTAFVQTNCTVRFPSRVVPYRYCSKSCSYCTDAPWGAPTCGQQAALDQSIDKYDQSAATEARIEGPCDYGYKCCYEHCDTCRRCSCSRRRRLLGDAADATEEEEEEEEEETEAGGEVVYPGPTAPQGEIRALLSRRRQATAVQRRNLKKSGCTTTCSTYRCNCYCVTSTYHQECTYSCRPHYETQVQISFPWRPDGAPPVDVAGTDPLPDDQTTVSTTVVHDFGDDRSAANAFLRQHFPVPPHDAANGTGPAGPALVLGCVYEPTWDPATDAGPYNQIREVSQLAFSDWELGYTAGWWVLFGVPAFFVVLLLMWCTGKMCEVMCCDRRERACYHRHFVLLEWSVGLWFGTILPLGVFLPVELGGKLIDEAAATLALDWTVHVLVGLGWAPMLRHMTGVRLGLDADAEAPRYALLRSTAPLLSNGRGAGAALSDADDADTWSGCATRFARRFGTQPAPRDVRRASMAFVLVGWVVPVAVLAPLRLTLPWVPWVWAAAVLGFGPECLGTRLCGKSSSTARNDAGGSVVQTAQRRLRSQSHRLRVDAIRRQLDETPSAPPAAAAAAAAVVAVVQATLPPPTSSEQVPVWVPPPSTARAWGAEAQGLIDGLARVKSTAELLRTLRRLTELNVLGQMSSVQRGSLIGAVADRRRFDTEFREVMWTPEVAAAYGQLLQS